MINMIADISISGAIINNLRGADDTTIFAANLLTLQNVLKRININCNNYELKMILKKTILMTHDSH